MSEFLALLSEQRYRLIEAIQIGALAGALLILGWMIVGQGIVNAHQVNVAEEPV